MKIQNNVVLVTGGASGLGAATVRRIVAAGGKALVADLNETMGKQLVDELGAATRFVRCDVAAEADAKAAVDAAAGMGRLVGLVNCAGIGPAAKTVGKDGPHRLDVFTKVITVNLIGTFNMIRIAATSMVRNEPNEEGERGVIVNTASVAAYDGQIGQAAYSASKGGIVGMTLPIARDLSRDGVRVVTIAPGLFLTPLMDSLPKEVQESLGRQVPFPSRLGRPEEYAQLVAQIFENTMLNGETIRLDGAIRMAPR
ncbi:MAG: SDR family NAD(P)-dependent oxidoreductase [Burkholderiaceae bacterium]|nr:SDR family NAD(P)-dependent oxidoreductase [Burkholderiaceae bacterium]